MRSLILVMFLLFLGLAASPAQARHHYRDGYYDANGNWVSTVDYRDDYRYERKVRSHKRRRNVLLGVGAVGLVTHSGGLTALGLGGAAANELIDRRHRDY